MSQQQQAAPVEAPRMVDASGRELSLLEMTRVMDVARTLRRERSVADQQLNLAETKQLLRDKLLEAARVTGDSVTEAEIDAAIENYYENLHEFRPPEQGWQTLLAHLYVRRAPIVAWGLALATAAAIVWGLWFSGALPGGPRTAMQAEQLYRDVANVSQTIESTTDLPLVRAEAASAMTQAEALRDQRDLTALTDLRDSLRAKQAILVREYRIVLADGNQTAVYRLYDDTQVSGYYLLVQAIDTDGQVIPLPIRNAEAEKTVTVRVWGEQIPKDVYDRLEADKRADGIVDEREFGLKQKGRLDEVVTLKGSDGNPIQRGRQITEW